MKKTCLALLVFLLFTACNRTPKNIIPRQEFIDLLIDLHLYDAIATDYSLKAQMNDVDSLMLYSSLFKKHHTDRTKFDATMNWYSGNPDEFAKIYDEVFGKLDKQNESLEKILKLFDSDEVEEVWSQKNYLNVIGDTAKYPEPFTVSVSDTGTYFFDIKLRMLLDDLSESPFISVYFYKNESDTNELERLQVVWVPIIKNNFIRDYKYVFKLKDETFKYIKIIIPDTPDRESGKSKNIQISRLRVLKKRNKPIETIPAPVTDTIAAIPEE
jgi:hypothetical protein